MPAEKRNTGSPMPVLRDLDPGLRRARLLAGREWGFGMARFAILRGHWDTGEAVRKHLPKEAGT